VDQAGAAAALATAAPTPAAAPAPAPAAAPAPAQPAAGGRPGLARAAAAVMAHALASDWQGRIARLGALSEAMSEQCEAGFGPADVAEVERVLPKLMAASDDGHFKVG
jgi:hypothetical protein